MNAANHIIVAELRRREMLDKAAQHRYASVALGAGSRRPGRPVRDVPRRALSVLAAFADAHALPVILLTLLGLLAVGGHAAHASDVSRPGAGPSLTTVAAIDQTARLFTVAGAGFTPGGRVYIAIYDPKVAVGQSLGARLYETRWVVADASVGTEVGSGNEPMHAVTGGTLREAFAGLCGATAMMRALDETTEVWSNWLTVQTIYSGEDSRYHVGPY